jgi:glycosyltransferase involved in cell wall biosynthesis
MVALAHGPRVLSLYEGFFAGGARILHTAVVRALAATGQRHSVLSMTNRVTREFTAQAIENDTCYRRLVAAGVPVRALDRSPEVPLRVGDLAIVEQSVRRADVILALKEQPLTPLTAVGTAGRPLVTCLHRSDPENQGSALAELRAAVAAGRVTALVCCADSTKAAYRAAGVPDSLLHVIPNGVDLRRFRPDRLARARLRRSLAIPDEAPLVAFAARYDVMKNVPLFLAAAARFLARQPTAHVLMCGTGMTRENEQLLTDLRITGLDESGRLHLLGPRDDPQALFAAADVVALTSVFGEAAPLCLIEGLLCGAIPVATDVGDCAAIVAGRGLLTPPDPDAIAAAWGEALARRSEFVPALLAAREQFGRRRMLAAYAALIWRAGGQGTRRRVRRVLEPVG